MKKSLDYILSKAVSKLISEAPARETNNANSDAVDSPFTPAEEKFLGKFDARGTNHLGIIYSTTDIGKAEFMSRSGADLNLTPEILDNLMNNGIIKIVPYTGFGHSDNYTLELQLSLDDIKGLGDEERKDIEAGSASAGGGMPPDTGGVPPTPPAPAAEEPAPPPNESVNKNKPLLTEQTGITKYKKILNYAFDFWDSIYGTIDDFDWDEATLKSKISSIPNRNHAMWIDVAGLILLYADNPKLSNARFIRTISETCPTFNLIAVKPSLKNTFHKLADLFDYNKVDSWYESDALDWSENINDTKKTFDSLRRNGIGVVKYKEISDDIIQPYALYTSYTAADILSIYNGLKSSYGEKGGKPVTPSDLLTNDEKIARAKAVWNTIVKNNLSPSWPKDKSIPDIRDIDLFNRGKVTAWVNSKGIPYVQVTNMDGKTGIWQMYSNGLVYDKIKKTWKRFQFDVNVDTGRIMMYLNAK